MMGHDHLPRTRVAMWAALVLTLSAAAIVGLLGLDPRIGAFALGLLVMVCLGACIATFWMDSRATRDTTRLIDQLRKRRARTTDGPARRRE